MEVVDPSPHFGVLSSEHEVFGDPGEPWRTLEEKSGPDGEQWELVEVVLTGGAPWGFTLRGGLEYQEPLIITKVEEGSRAASAQLQAGDEIVSINAVLLRGSRQEAICLVKGSYRTLELGLKRKMKMVDVVAHTVPGESDVRVARSFLTKILRSSMRRNRFKGRNEPFCRPHSWHSSKVSEDPPDVPVLEPVWQTKCDAGSSSNDFNSCWGQTNLRQVPCKFSSEGNMESVEPCSSKPPGAAEHSLAAKGVCKHDVTPDQSSSRNGAAPTDRMFYRGSPSERHRYLQIPMSNGGRVSPKMEEQTGSRFSSTGRLNLNPVWHVPEKSTAAHSPPPPPPPLRSDSFAATKVHEKGLEIPFPQGSPAYSHQKSHSRGHFDGYPFRERGPESRSSYNPPSKKDVLHVYLSPEDSSPNQLNPNRLVSVSSTDVRQGQSPFACEPQHQRQHSDEGPFYLHPGNMSASRTQTVGTYYHSLQHLPTNTGSQNRARSSTEPPSSTAAEHSPDGMAHFRYYCITAQQPTRETSERRVEDGWRLASENTQGVNDWNPSSQRAVKAKYPPPYLQASENKNSNGYSKQTVSPPASEVTSPGQGPVIPKSNSGEKEKENPWKKDVGIAENLQSQRLPNHQAEQRSPAHRNIPKESWISKNEHKICPQKTPLLHSLAQESRTLAGGTTVRGTQQETPDPSSGKQGRRSDRYATTLRNEIQEKRSQLQKSRSAATLTCPGETEEDAGFWKSNETSTSSSDGSFTNTYKDNLKEAQARVLQATSFKRRDLELPGNDPATGQSSTKADPTNGQVTRIGSRKRFPIYKRVHSFSEPDKMNEVGVEGKGSQQSAPSSHQAASFVDVASFVDRCKFFEGASRPTFSRPVPKQSHLSPSEDGSVGDSDRKSFSGHQTDRATAAEEQRRLGTFAEYEATWNLQRKSSEGRASSRYRSAENILDSGVEERSSVCIHERSRSSPSADFHGARVSLLSRKPEEEFHPESQPGQQELHTDRLEPPLLYRTSQRGHCRLHISEPLDLNMGNDPDPRDVTAPLTSTHTTKASSPPAPHPHHLQPRDPVLEHLPPTRTSPAPQKPSQLREDRATPAKTTCPSSSLEALPSPGHSMDKGPHPAGAPGPNGGSENDKPPSEAAAPSAWVSPQRLADNHLASMEHRDLHSNTTGSPSASSCLKTPPSGTVHGESHSEDRPFLDQDTPGGPDGTANHQLRQPSPSEQAHSLSHNYTYQRPPDSSPSGGQTIAGSGSENSETPRLRTAPARRSAEDEKREELARDIMVRDRSLVDILDQSKMKTTMDLMEGLYPQGEQILEGVQQRRKSGPKQTSPRTTRDRRAVGGLAASVSLATSSSYYSTSAPKAELLIKMKDMQEQMEDQDSGDELDYDLSSKKQELIHSLSKKLQVLHEARESLQEEVQDNNALGEEVEATVQAVCKPNELDKFRMFAGDLDKVVSLLLSLSGRLARVENALNNLEEGASPEEKLTLTEKRKLLIRQHEDAKELKDNLDRRERVVYDILAGHLSEDRLADYQHFVKMKSALIIEQRQLEDRIKLGEEQLKCLRDSLPLEQRLRY